MNHDRDGAERRPAEAVMLSEWREKADANIEDWGLQDVETLLLAMQEEQGELAQAYLEARAEGGDPARVPAELADLGALCIQLSRRLDE